MKGWPKTGLILLVDLVKHSFDISKYIPMSEKVLFNKLKLRHATLTPYMRQSESMQRKVRQNEIRQRLPRMFPTH